MLRTTTILAAALASLPLALPAMAAEPKAEAEAFYAAFAKGLNGNDVDGLLALYAPEASFVPQPGVELTKREDIAGALTQFTQMSDDFQVTLRAAYASGDTVLAIADWTLTGKDAAGQPLTLKGSTSDVLVRGADGKLLALIDNPFGSAAPAK